eukprot:3938462-Rhodomonas_salina.4
MSECCECVLVRAHLSRGPSSPSPDSTRTPRSEAAAAPGPTRSPRRTGGAGARSHRSARQLLRGFKEIAGQSSTGRTGQVRERICFRRVERIKAASKSCGVRCTGHVGESSCFRPGRFNAKSASAGTLCTENAVVCAAGKEYLGDGHRISLGRDPDKVDCARTWGSSVPYGAVGGLAQNRTPSDTWAVAAPYGAIAQCRMAE